MTGHHGRTSRLDRVVLAVIGVNAVVLVDGHERVFDTVHDAIIAFFLLELLARLRAHGWQFLRRPFNAFDAAVIVVSALPFACVDASLLRLARLARLLHFAKHAAQLRLLPVLARSGQR